MWRLLPILLVIGFAEVLIPWPDVAALVLSNQSPTAAYHTQTSGGLR